MKKGQWPLPEELAATLGSMDPPLGISVGIAYHDPASRDTIDDLIRRADRAMYEVKRSGRGHWRVAHSRAQ
jgi:GGDEF domain-containing protein